MYVMGIALVLECIVRHVCVAVVRVLECTCNVRVIRVRCTTRSISHPHVLFKYTTRAGDDGSICVDLRCMYETMLCWFCMNSEQQVRLHYLNLPVLLVSI